MDNLTAVYQAALKAINKDLEEGENTFEFLNFHMEELNAENLQELTKMADRS
ncbi:hypothetical protein [Mucilaginibacter sp. CSA2-8R]|uniref:hypothetical protein n=1 Tax=Mucilaginibacter sp. CSA2-8R TaxID=3141542 RepID=UPI00315DE834